MQNLISSEGIYIANKELQINEEIRDAQVRVISDSGEQLGIMSGKEAFTLALEKGLEVTLEVEYPAEEASHLLLKFKKNFTKSIYSNIFTIKFLAYLMILTKHTP